MLTSPRLISAWSQSRVRTRTRGTSEPAVSPSPCPCPHGCSPLATPASPCPLASQGRPGVTFVGLAAPHLWHYHSSLCCSRAAHTVLAWRSLGTGGQGAGAGHRISSAHRGCGGSSWSGRVRTRGSLEPGDRRRAGVCPDPRGWSGGSWLGVACTAQRDVGLWEEPSITELGIPDPVLLFCPQGMLLGVVRPLVHVLPGPLEPEAKEVSNPVRSVCRRNIFMSWTFLHSFLRILL